MSCPEKSASFQSIWRQPAWKERVPAPVVVRTPYTLAKETGCPEGITARQTAAPLAQGDR